MAYSQDGFLRPYPSDADLSAEGAGQYRAVKRTATGFALCGAADVDFLGVLQDDPKLGESGTIKVGQATKAHAGAAIAITDELTTDSTGRFIAATTGNVVVGRPLEAAAAAGDLFAMEIRPGGIK